MPAIHAGPQNRKEKNKAHVGNGGKGGSVGNNSSAEFFLLSNACVLSLMGREEEKLWSVLSEGQLLMGQTK